MVKVPIPRSIFPDSFDKRQGVKLVGGDRFDVTFTLCQVNPLTIIVEPFLHDIQIIGRGDLNVLGVLVAWQL